MQQRISRFSATEQELRREFKRVDTNRDGRISFQEFQDLLVGLEADMDPSAMSIGFAEVDTDKDGIIDAREFIEWWSAD